MKIYFNLVDGRLDGWSSTKRGNSFEAEVPDDHEVLSNFISLNLKMMSL